MPTEINRTDLRRFAILGAEARLLAIAEEAAAIYRVFPELRDRPNNGDMAAINGRRKQSVSAGVEAGGRRRRRMSAAQREAVGERMKKYWAARRGEAKEPQATESASQTQVTESKPAPDQGAAKRSKQPRGAAERASRKTPRGRRHMSAASRKRISEAQTARWAKQRKKTATQPPNLVTRPAARTGARKKK